MAHFDAVVIGAGLGGLTSAAILARAGRAVLVIERSNSVGGAASSYKVGDLFVEGSLQLTSDPKDPRDPKHDIFARAGIADAVTWISTGDVYVAQGGPLERPFRCPAGFDAAQAAATARFPDSSDGIARYFAALLEAAALPHEPDSTATLVQKLDEFFGGNEAVKCAMAANLWMAHDDPATLAWSHFARMQGGLLRSGGAFVQGGSQRLSSALARVIRRAGGEVLLRRVATAIECDADGNACGVVHEARDGGEPQRVACDTIIGNPAPAALAAMLPARGGGAFAATYLNSTPSISLFMLTLGLSRRPRECGIGGYMTQLLPAWMSVLADYAAGASLLGNDPGEKIPPLSIVDYDAIESGIPTPPFVLSVVGPDRLSNWNGSDAEQYRARRARWQDALIDHLDGVYPGLRAAITDASFNTALSVRQYLNTPAGEVYGFAPTAASLSASPRTPVPRLYLASAYAGRGGYTGVVEAAAACAEMVLQERP